MLTYYFNNSPHVNANHTHFHTPTILSYNVFLIDLSTHISNNFEVSVPLILLIPSVDMEKKDEYLDQGASEVRYLPLSSRDIAEMVRMYCNNEGQIDEMKK